MSNDQVTKAKGSVRSTDGQSGVQSVDRAITVLEILARDGHAGVSEVAAEVGVHKSTAFRLLAALEERDLVEQNSERGKYQLAFGILRLASAIPMRMDVVRQAQPVLDALALELGETINLAVAREHYAVNVQQARGSAAVASQNWVGQLTPLHATSSGKVLLAFMSDEQREAVLEKTGLPSVTPKTLSSREKLLDALQDIRTSGFATASGELEEGLNAAAVPVRDHTGNVVAALSVSGPAYRFDRAQMAAVEERLRAAGDQVSYRMGSLG